MKIFISHVGIGRNRCFDNFKDVWAPIFFECSEYIKDTVSEFFIIDSLNDCNEYIFEMLVEIGTDSVGE